MHAVCDRLPVQVAHAALARYGFIEAWEGREERSVPPTGKSAVHLSSPFSKNIPVPFWPKSPAYRSPSCPTEGRLAIVTNAGQDVMDAGGAFDESADLADGEVVWSWRPDAGVKLMEAISSMTVANKPVTGESSE
jgi:hypothetical protein